CYAIPLSALDLDFYSICLWSKELANYVPLPGISKFPKRADNIVFRVRHTSFFSHNLFRHFGARNHEEERCNCRMPRFDK
ncbi:hypothetical protein L9F63_017681, partial [Diploptera punctata]